MIRTCIHRRIINNDVLLPTAPLICCCRTSSLGGFCLLNYFGCSSTKEAQLWQWGFPRIIGIYCCRSAHYARQKGKKNKTDVRIVSSNNSREGICVSIWLQSFREQKDYRNLSEARADDWFINSRASGECGLNADCFLTASSEPFLMVTQVWLSLLTMTLYEVTQSLLQTTSETEANGGWKGILTQA